MLRRWFRRIALHTDTRYGRLLDLDDALIRSPAINSPLSCCVVGGNPIWLKAVSGHYGKNKAPVGDLVEQVMLSQLFSTSERNILGYFFVLFPAHMITMGSFHIDVLIIYMSVI